MNPLLLEIMPLVKEGWCCSQMLLLLLLQALDRENPDLVRAVHGLCHGQGDSEGPCGLLTGGACALGCLAGRGTAGESAHPSFTPLLSDYRQWFAGRTEAYGGIACFRIMEGLSARTGITRPAAGETPNPALCGDLFAECWEKILSLLEAYEIPMEGR